MKAEHLEVENQVQPVLYEKRVPIFTRSVKGKFRTFKTAMLALAFTVYFGLPWLPWARTDAPGQAVLFDLGGRRFFIFDLVFYPQDIFALSLLLFISAVLLFFVTGLVGRVFCGYFCFQTLWTDAFIFIERLVQGERPARIRLYKQPWNAEKIARYALTHGLWLLVAFWTAVTFVLYFGYAPELIRSFFTGTAAFVAYFTVLVLTLTTYVAAGLAREQVCTYMCPYARFQGVMVEPETLVVAYDVRRGEGPAGRMAARAGLRSREERLAKGHGDCIDCGLCVQVCPAGIDIRDGLQYKCISCGLCIDACNNIMDSMGFPRGLIRYDSQQNMASDNPGKPHVDWLRLRTIGYGVALLVMTGALIYNIASRSDIQLSVQPVRQPLFVILSDGDIRNRYQIHITNKSGREESYRIGVRGLPPGALDLGSMSEVRVRPGKSLMVMASVKLSPAAAEASKEFEFVITPASRPDHATVKKVRFYARHEGI
jgi:cytochrome c oxidase accessory protein FixG